MFHSTPLLLLNIIIAYLWLRTTCCFFTGCSSSVWSGLPVCEFSKSHWPGLTIRVTRCRLSLMFLWFVSCDTDHNSSPLLMLLRTLNMHCLTSHNYTKVLVPPVTGSNSNLSTPGVVVSSTLITTQRVLLQTHTQETHLNLNICSCYCLGQETVSSSSYHRSVNINSWSETPQWLVEMLHETCKTRDREGDQTILLLLHISQLLRLHSILLLLRVVGKFPLCPIPTATSNLSSLLCLASQTQKLSTLAATI